MLFNSHEFVLAFLPLCILGFFLIGRSNREAAAAFLGAASFLFYGWWDWRFIPLLAASTAFNFLCGRAVSAPGDRGKRFYILVGAVMANLALLGYFKYAGFFISTANDLFAVGWTVPHVLLPLGISFFTFTQIAFLVDSYRDVAREYKPSHYALFVSFFPHLIAGPIIHHKDVMPQFALPQTYRPQPRLIALGLTLFTIGLVKKVWIADGIAPFANTVFSAAAVGLYPTFFEAWSGAIAYAMQLYFDFSGYSDMAVGGALLFGIWLPFNFESPYRATNVIEFWRRWHMTLSRFLRDYLYFPLGGNRLGAARRYANIIIVMILGGLWHGAGWTFVIWGGLHGVYLLVNHAWRAMRGTAEVSSSFRRLACWAATFTAVVVAWVFFRADTPASAHAIVNGMFGLNGIELGLNHRSYLGAFASLAERFGVTFAAETRFSALSLPWIAGCLFICVGLPNSQVILRHIDAWLSSCGPFMVRTLASGFAIAAAITVAAISGKSEFLYFNF
jgi:alginate O-acetyltransferase complex protein AlgI